MCEIEKNWGCVSIMKSSLIPLGLILSFASYPVAAQSQTDADDLPLIVGNSLDSPTIVAAPVETAPPVEVVGQADVIALDSYLQLRNGQIERLEKIYEEYASERIKQENKLDKWQGEFEVVQAPATLNQERASELARGIHKAQKKVADKFASTRSQALDVLSSAQRTQLQKLKGDPKVKVATDVYFQLLYMPLADFWRLPLAPQNERQAVAYREPKKKSSGVGNYGVYAGYGYGGVDYGVYTGYKQNGIGIHAGIGRRGPTVDMSIGNFSVGSLLQLFR